MTIPEQKIYPRTGDRQTVYLKAVITDPNISVGDYTMYDTPACGKRRHPGTCERYPNHVGAYTA